MPRPTRPIIRLHLLVFIFLQSISGTVFGHPGEHERLQRINRAIEQQPNRQALYIQRGYIYSQNDEFDSAVADFQKAEALGPPVAVALNQGTLYYRMLDFNKATDYLDRYIKAFPNSAQGYETRARVSRDAGNRQQAVKDLQNYFELVEKPHPGSYLSAANMLHDMNQTATALQLLDKGIDQLGLTPVLQRRAIELELQQGQVSNAIARQDSLRAALHANPLWKLEMAELLLMDNRDTDAQQLAWEAEHEILELRPTPARLQQLNRAQELLKSLSTP